MLEIKNLHANAGDARILNGIDLTIAPGEVRTIENRRNDVCNMLVVIPYPPESTP